VIKATDKSWSSATILYIARRLAEIAGDRQIAVLDMGCGNGRIIEDLVGYGHDLYGYDLARTDVDHDEGRRQRLLPAFGSSYDDHIKVTDSERDIPFADGTFDVVYANQVFEHIRFLDRMLAECARVLKPGGTLLVAFPLATSALEEHLRVPLAHWLPPGMLRIGYLRLLCAVGLLRRWPGEEDYSTLQVALVREAFLRDKTFYRFINEITSVSGYYFETCRVETDLFLRAKLDLLEASPGGIRKRVAALLRILERRRLVSPAVTYLANVALGMQNPRKETLSSGK
jgi:SAM-dependent methyltransferase